MIYLKPDGTYRASSPDAEFARDLSREEGIAILRAAGCPEEIINDPTPGFVMT